MTSSCSQDVVVSEDLLFPSTRESQATPERVEFAGATNIASVAEGQPPAELASEVRRNLRW
jgi:hypothetical protein